MMISTIREGIDKSHQISVIAALLKKDGSISEDYSSLIELIEEISIGICNGLQIIEGRDENEQAR